MNTNNIYHANTVDFRLESAVNRSSKELTILARWSSFDISTLSNNSDAMADLFESGFPCVDEVPNPSDTTAKLFPVNNALTRLQNKKAALMYLYFYPISIKSSGGAGKTASDVNNAIRDSNIHQSHSHAFNQTVIRNSAMVTHQPNFFRPKFVVNDVIDYFDEDETSGIYPTGDPSTIFKPEFALGLHLPHEENGNIKALRIYPTITNIEVYAHTYQKIDVGGDWVYQKYPVFCEAKFIVED